jgi:protein dithiol oxidoreductase (disulfide-forming)
MTRISLALFSILVFAACSAETPAAPTAAQATAAAPAQQQPQARTEARASDRPTSEQIRLAQAGTTAPQSNARFVAGQHYRLLNPAQPTTVAPGKVEVVDVFWYGCGGCFAMYPYMEAWKASKPEVAEYVQLPATMSPGWQPHARLHYATRTLGISDQTHSAIFREYHVNRNPLNTMDSMIQFLSRFNVSESDARDALTAFSVDTQLRAADVRARRYQLSAVPAFVVNGKYVVSVAEAGGPEGVLEVINYLVALEAGQLEQAP